MSCQLTMHKGVYGENPAASRQGMRGIAIGFSSAAKLDLAVSQVLHAAQLLALMHSLSPCFNAVNDSASTSVPPQHSTLAFCRPKVAPATPPVSALLPVWSAACQTLLQCLTGLLLL